MAVDIKAVQDKARLAMRGKPNIIERSSMWLRMVRMDEPPEPTDEVLKTEVRSLRRGYSFLLKELNTLKGKKAVAIKNKYTII